MVFETRGQRLFVGTSQGRVQEYSYDTQHELHTSVLARAQTTPQQQQQQVQGAMVPAVAGGPEREGQGRGQGEAVADRPVSRIIKPLRENMELLVSQGTGKGGKRLQGAGGLGEQRAGHWKGPLRLPQGNPVSRYATTVLSCV